MKFIVKFCIKFCFLILFLCPLWTWGYSTSSAVQVGVLDFAPFYVVKDGTPISGIMADLIRDILDEAKIPYEITAFPAKRLFSHLADGTTHIFIGIKNVPEYSGKVLYGPTPVEQIRLNAYSIGSTRPIRSKEDLIGQDIMIMRGYGYAGLKAFIENPANRIRYTESDSHLRALLMLEKRRIKYVLNYSHPVENVLKDNPIDDLKSFTLSNVPAYLIVSKKAPEAEKLMSQLIQGYETVMKKRAARRAASRKLKQTVKVGLLGPN